MSIHTIKTPDIGEGIAEVELVAWRVAVGDTVAEDQILADVMTDKATVEIPSSVAGTVVELGGLVGQIIAVGSDLIRIETEASIRLVVSEVLTTEARQTDTPEPARLELVANPENMHAPAAPFKHDAPVASPAIRQRARELGLDLKLILGSGPDGRIIKSDLNAVNSNQLTNSQHKNAGLLLEKKLGETKIPVVGMRRKIAQKMQEAKRKIPHFTYVEEIDVTELELLRGRLNAKYEKTRGRLTFLPFLMRAMVLAIREFPQVNVRYDDEAEVITQYDAVHLGIATQTEAGLMVPVVRHAEARTLWTCALEVQRLAEVARSGKIIRDELSGSTITITSLGPLGGVVSTPVINYPEVAIVGTNRIVERPMIRGGSVVARQMMNLSSSFDHRVIDGVLAANFVQSIRGYLEFPATLFVE